MKNTLITILSVFSCAFPVVSFAEASTSFPAFPMSFYGGVTVNSVPAPIGAVLRVYYGENIAGEYTTERTGEYGSTDPFAKQLLIKEGAGPITFTLISPTQNSGAVMKSVDTYPEFSSNSIQNKTLSFTYTVPAVSSGGGGGGGGGGSSVTTTQTPTVTPPVATGTKAVIIQKSAIQPQQVCISLISSPLIYGQNNNVEEVKKLQKFLNSNLGLFLPINGNYGLMTKGAVEKFQIKYRGEILGVSPASGNVYAKTIAKINSLSCAQVGLVVPEVLGATTINITKPLQMTREEIIVLIQKLLIQLQILKNQAK